MISATEEDYIKAIFNISRKIKNAMVGTNQIAKEVNTSPASVTDMLKKLKTKDLIQYEKYKGVKLNPTGTKRAVLLLRRHRLWESFLVEKLGFGWDEVHDLAEQLEHIESDELINKLDDYLGNPKFDPHGDPIPDVQGIFTLRNQQLVQHLSVGESGIVVGVKKHDKDFLHHLSQFKIEIGKSISVLEKFAYDNSISVKIDGQKDIMIGAIISENVFVKKL